MGKFAHAPRRVAHPHYEVSLRGHLLRHQQYAHRSRCALEPIASAAAMPRLAQQVVEPGDSCGFTVHRLYTKRIRVVVD
jgi:hypothetical protein